ncbi:Guanylate cyclase [Seminavis robusta]|uniref:Guanylate cyclase n=1 Tax=Seminavis robusta TaxID=568900 RepID=A0A9N8DJ86_9STRA|nr:Guanylate cyclase [Seminavis robusta]|eukprot:Sro114_g056400.1 Guanylate cyclase (690) ;mRNA; r:54850-57108
MKSPPVAVLLLLLSSMSHALEQQPQCGLWMAASTLGDATNLGMYAGQDIEKGVDIQNEIAIPLLFRNWDAPDYHDTDDGQLWDRYIWEGEVANVETYDNSDLQQTKAVFVPGIGCTINSVLDMNNVESTHGSTYDTAGLHRSKDPGSGAFTPYYGTHTVSTRDISAGSEIYAAYGDQWIPDIPGAQVTFHKNLEAAEEFLRDDYYRFVKSQKDPLPAHVKEGLWNFTRDFPVHQNQIFTVLPRNVPWSEIETVLEQKLQEEADVPYNTEYESDDEADTGPTLFAPDNMVTHHFIRQQSKRDVQWLQEHGRCCDHIRADKSTIPQAGRGAFATRDLPKGTIVGYSPLIPVALEGEQVYNIPYGSKDPNYEPFMDENGKEVVEEGYEMKDLVINYSFGHKDSTMMLTPYGSMINYINHGAGDKANVKVVWPSHEMVAHKPEWLTRNVTTIRYTLDKIGLSFDYVALRDIKEGEEILMDYGPEWEAAWRKHVIDWEPLAHSEEYVHSSEWPHDEPLRTEAEQETNPYPDNLETMCVESYMKDPRTMAYKWIPVLRKSYFRVACTVLERHEPKKEGKQHSYRVEMLIGVDEATGEDQTIIVDRVPHKWIFLTDKVKSADWHMPNTFRHTIAIPDEIFPPAWKNKLTGEGMDIPPPKKKPAATMKPSTISSGAPAGAKAAGAPAGARASAKEEL